MLEDYEIQLHQKRQNLKQRDLDISSYTEQFQKLCTRSHVAEDENLKVVRYLSGLKWNIQEEMTLLSPTTVHQCYQLVIKIEENQRGHRGDYQGRGTKPRNQGESKAPEHWSETTTRGGHGRGRGSQGRSNKGRGSGRSNSYFASIKCYSCGQLGHPTYRCPKKASSSNNEKRIGYAQEDTSSFKSPEINHIELEMGENLMFRRVLVRQPMKEEPERRKALLRIRCKIVGKVCKVIVDSGSTDNMISEEAVKKLKLEKIPHTNPYKVTCLTKGKVSL